MPQMSPLLWLNLMIFFLLSLLVYFGLIYFIKTPSKIGLVFGKKKVMQKTWKW